MAKQTQQVKTKPLSPISLPNISPLAVLGILFGLVLIFYSPILFGGKFLWEDFVEQEFPFRTFATSSLAAGHIPQWNPYVFSGMPFIADIQIAFWYPFNMLQSLFVSGDHLSPVIMQWFIIMHYFIAAAGMFYLVKNIFKTDDWSAIFAAIVYAFSGYLTAQPMHQMIVYQLALFPFVVLLFLKGCDSWKHSIGAGLVLGTMYLAGHPQTSLYLTFFLGLLAVYEIIFRIRNKDGEKFTAVTFIRMVIPAIIAFGLFAIQLLPAQELAALSRRDVITFEKSVEGSLGFGHLATLILPQLFGVTDAMREAKVQYWNGPYYLSWETMCYIGVLPLLFAILAAFGNRIKVEGKALNNKMLLSLLVGRIFYAIFFGILNEFFPGKIYFQLPFLIFAILIIFIGEKKYISFFAGMSLLAVLFALGDHSFLYKIFFQLPLFNKLRTPARMMMVFTFAMCALAGVGLSQAIRRELPDRTRKIIYGCMGVFGLIWIAALAGMFTPQSFLAGAPPETAASISWAAGLAALPVLAMLIVGFLLIQKKSAGMPLALGVIALTIIELFNYGMGINASTEDPRVAYNEQPALVAQIKEDQAKELSRAKIRSAHAMLLKRNEGAYDRIQLFEGYDPLVLQRSSPDCSNNEMQADLMNIKWTVEEKGGSAGFVQRQTYLPRVKMYYKTTVHPDEEAKQLIRTDSSFNYRNVILLEEKPGIDISVIDSSAKAQVIRFETNEIEAKVSTKENGMLFFSEVYYPAWHAYIDGKETKLYRAFTSLRAVEVPKGDHTIVLKYESNAFKTGSMITLSTLGLSLAALGVFAFGKKKS